MNKVPRLVFRYVGNKTYDFSSKKKGFFAPKRPNLAHNWHFWLIWARPCRFFQCPVGGSVGGCGARAVSRKTPIYFITRRIYDIRFTRSEQRYQRPRKRAIEVVNINIFTIIKMYLAINVKQCHAKIHM